MREDESLVSQVVELLRDSEELKTAQLVGNAQIVVRHTQATVSVTSTSETYITRCFAACRVTATNLNPGNVLICYCMPEVRVNGTLVDNLSTTYEVDISKADEGFIDRMGFQANIYHSDDSGVTIPAETYSVTFHVFSSADVELTVWEGEFDA